MMKKLKRLFSFLTLLIATLSLLLFLAGCGAGTDLDTHLQTMLASEPGNLPDTQSATPTPLLEVPTEPGDNLAATATPLSKAEPKTQSSLDGTYNCFAQGVPSASGYANTYLFRPDGTWADITYGKQYASVPKYNFTYRLVGADLTLVYPSGNSTYRVETENGKYKLVQYGDKLNQTCYQKV